MILFLLKNTDLQHSLPKAAFIAEVSCRHAHMPRHRDANTSTPLTVTLACVHVYILSCTGTHACTHTLTEKCLWYLGFLSAFH